MNATSFRLHFVSYVLVFTLPWICNHLICSGDRIWCILLIIRQSFHFMVRKSFGFGSFLDPSHIDWCKISTHSGILLTWNLKVVWKWWICTGNKTCFGKTVEWITAWLLDSKGYSLETEMIFDVEVDLIVIHKLRKFYGSCHGVSVSQRVD